MQDLIIKPYSEEEAAALAQHINESSHGWPGSGLTHGIEMDEERAREWFESVNFIGLYMGWAGERLLGFSSLTGSDKDSKVAYIPLLNVHPDYQGKGVGRKLLCKCVEEAIEKKFRRLDLHTWAANLKAVPLYKKTGFFWKKDTSVHMVNYLPLIMQNSLARDFFAEHDWFKCFVRELKIAEDDEKWQGMQVYSYRWEAGDDFLEVKIDTEGEGITSISTPQLSIDCAVKNQRCPAGAPNSFVLKVSADEDGEMLMKAQGEDGLDLVVEEGLHLSHSWEKEIDFAVEENMSLKEKDEPAHKITTQIFWQGKLLSLETGVRVTEVIAASWGDMIPDVQVGKEGIVHLNIENAMDKEIKASVHILDAGGLLAVPLEKDVNLPARGKGGLDIKLEGRKRGFYELKLMVSYNFRGEKLQARPQILPVCVRGPGEVMQGATQEEAFLINDQLLLKVALKGGEGKVFEKNGRKKEILEMETDLIGPKYYPPVISEVHLKPEFAGSTLLLHGELPGRERLYFCREITLDGNIIYNSYTVANGGTAEEKLLIRLAGTVSPEYIDRVAIPLDGRVIIEDFDLDTFPGPGNLPRDEERYTEDWYALMGEDLVLGSVIPPGEGKYQVGESQLLTRSIPLVVPSCTEKKVTGVTFYAGPGDWRTVARLAATLGRVKGEELCESGVLKPEWQDDIPVLPYGKGTGHLTVYYPCAKSLSGRIIVEYPPAFKKEKEGFKTVFQDKKPWKNQLDFIGPVADKGIYPLQVKIEAGSSIRNQELPVIISGGKGEVKVEKDGSLWRLENGLLELMVDEDFAGSGVSLKIGDLEVLESPYPQPGTYYWINPWYGGINPILIPLPSRTYPGYLWQEKFVGQEVSRTGRSGKRWQGLLLDVEPQRQELSGLKLSLSYLLIEDSPFLALVYGIKNHTDYRQKLKIQWGIFLEPGIFTSYKTIKGDKMIERLLEQEGSFLMGKELFHLQGKTDFLIVAGKENILSLEENPNPFRQFLQAGPFTGLELAPGEEKELVTYLILPQQVNSTSIYGCLNNKKGLF